jgi:hypothetical protein
MKCQNCGNELDQDEVFCGQCGVQNTTPAQPTEMMQAPAPRGGLLSDAYRSGAFAPNQANPPFSHTNMPGPLQSTIHQAPQKSGGFYQDATEAVSIVPGTPANYPSPYPQQGLGGGSPAGGYNNPGQFGTQTQQQFLGSSYSNPNFPPTHTGFPSGQFGQGAGMAPRVQKRNNVVMIVGIVCLICAIITVGVFGAIYALRSGNSPQHVATPVAQATAASTPTPTPRPTPSPTPTPLPSPTPTTVPTPMPDASFSWCTSCTQGGYMIEYPNGWSQSTTQDQQGTQFTDAAQTDTYAAVKTPGAGASATDLLAADTGEFSNQPGFQGPQGTQNATIGGTNWSYQTISYQLNGQPEQVNVYATVYQGKGYILELQAQQGQFANIYGQYFNPMLTRFQFVAPGP